MYDRHQTSIFRKKNFIFREIFSFEAKHLLINEICFVIFPNERVETHAEGFIEYL